MIAKFIGRKKELEQIRSFFSANETGFLCIEGGGGIGKTRLLTQIGYSYETEQDIRVIDIIDFDDPQFHLPDSIGRIIAQQLDDDAFTTYLNEIRHKRFLEEHKASPEYLARQAKIIEEEFLRAYNKVTGQHRVMLRFDTIDNLKGLYPPLEYVSRLVASVPHTYIIFAGRNSTQMLSMLTQIKKSIVLKLEALSREECSEYLKEKLEMNLMSMDELLQEKLVLLSRGRIIILDLAVEWLLREKIPQWLRDLDVKDLLSGKDHTVDRVDTKFESRLFEHVRALRTDVDRLALLLSKVHPLDKEGIASLLVDLSSADIDSLLQKARTLTFIKEIPNGYLKLHDEAEYLVNKHVWPHIDPLRANYTREAAIIYLDKRSESILNEMKLKDGINLEYTFYTYRVQQLRHILNIDIARAFEVFRKNWYIAEEQFKSPLFQKILLDEIIPFKSRLLPPQQWEIMLLQAKRLLNEEQYHIAIDEYLNVLLEIFVSEDTLYKVRALIERGNAFIRLGHIEQAIRDMEKAGELSKQLQNVEWEVRSLLALGWLQRLKGDFRSAINDYLGILRRTLEIGDIEKQARIQRELAHLKSLEGESEAAVHLIEQAIRSWRHLSAEKKAFYEDLGKAYYLAGIIYRENSQVDKAMSYFTWSMEIFGELNLEEWRSSTRAQLGVTRWIQGKYEEAEVDLTWALEQSAPVNMHEVRYYLAHVKWMRGDRTAAAKMFRESLAECQVYGDAFFELQTLCSIARLAFEYESESLSTWQDLKYSYDGYLQRHASARFPALRGIFIAHLGHLAAKQSNYQEMLQFYKDGLPQIAGKSIVSQLKDFGLYGQFRFINSKIIRLLNAQRIEMLGTQLEDIWTQQGLDIAHPEILTFLLRWKREQK